MKKLLLVAASALLLGACASSGMHDGMVYRDGSWYAPADAGHGDYYTGVEHHHDMAYDWPWAWSVGFVPYGGYCPVQYRYCTSFWADPFYAGPGYYPYAYNYAWQSGSGHRHRARQEPDEVPLVERNQRARPSREPTEPRSFQPRSGGLGAGGPRRDGGEPRPRRRTSSAGASPN